MDKIFKVTTDTGIYFVVAINKDWAHEYFCRIYHKDLGDHVERVMIKEMQGKMVISKEDFEISA